MSGAGNFTYRSLINLDLRHDFFASGYCPDLSIQLEPETQKLLSYAGIVFRQSTSGYSVFYDHRRLAEIRAHATGEQTPSIELRFSMHATDPLFANRTELATTDDDLDYQLRDPYRSDTVLYFDSDEAEAEAVKPADANAANAEQQFRLTKRPSVSVEDFLPEDEVPSPIASMVPEALRPWRRTEEAGAQVEPPTTSEVMAIIRHAMPVCVFRLKVEIPRDQDPVPRRYWLRFPRRATFWRYILVGDFSETEAAARPAIRASNASGGEPTPGVVDPNFEFKTHSVDSWPESKGLVFQSDKPIPLREQAELQVEMTMEGRPPQRLPVASADRFKHERDGDNHLPVSEIFVTVNTSLPQSVALPVERITTNLTWHDLVLDQATLGAIEEILSWIEHSQSLMDDWGLAKFLKPGYRALFSGPPGTGKALTAALIGDKTKRDVYRVDLSTVVSKYIGETDGKLAALFDQAERKNWILFFDEADALFGKRTATSSSNDRHANQMVSYLLQRIEDSPQLVILATSMKSNIDEAFARRFQATLHFPMPDTYQRKKLWEMMLPSDRLAEGLDLDRIAQDHELAGGAILNVVQRASLAAIGRTENPVITEQDLLRGIAQER